LRGGAGGARSEAETSEVVGKAISRQLDLGAILARCVPAFNICRLPSDISKLPGYSEVI
jgi:hypothetical protein